MRTKASTLIYTALLLVSFALGSSFSWNDHAQAKSQEQTQEAKEQQKAAKALPRVKPGEPLPANLFVELAKMVNPAIVNISTSMLPSQPTQGRLHNDPMFEMLERFWGGGGGFSIPNQRGPRPAQALGSGFVIRDDGLIITNNHVIAGADVITVQIGDSDTSYEATVVGTDKDTDIALIKVDADKKLPKLNLGDSETLEVGEWVAAFGNPFGHAHSMTKGIISAKGREIDALNQFPFLQTDASINPGNSGGPLVNTRGEVIGVNTAIDARAQGIGFAIPINSVKTILTQLEKDGRVRRGFLGVSGVSLSEVTDVARMSMELEADKGVFVMQVEPASAAEKAGIKVYDVITEFNGKKIESMQDLVRAVGATVPGKQTEVKIDRQGSKKTLKAKVEERPTEQLIGSNTPRKQIEGQDAPFDLGFQVAPITEEMRRAWGLDPRVAKKPIIVDVESSSPARRAGLREGDIILDVNRKPVNNPKDVLRSLRKGTNALRIVRGNQPPTLVLIEVS